MKIVTFQNGKGNRKMKTIIHVIGKRIRNNEDNPIKIIQGKNISYVNEITIQDKCKIVYSPDKPLNDGAKLWIEIEK